MADDEDGRFEFRLPPLRIPSFDLGDVEVSLPVPDRITGDPLGGRGVLALAVLVDVVDAALLLGLSEQALLVRSVVLLGVAPVLVGRVGLLAGWESIAVVLGSAEATAVPSLTLLVLLRGAKITG